jgi:hypothetical protein
MKKYTREMLSSVSELIVLKYLGASSFELKELYFDWEWDLYGIPH